ncbi:MAG TPA: hypothetical protein VJI33_02230 [Candidatus Paceibacterota bacterium]
MDNTESSFKRPTVETILDGKINWRGWVPYPKGFSDDRQSLLDKVAEFTELAPEIHGSDDLEKFDVFTRIALSKGLINKEEYLDIQRSKHKAA